MKFCPECGTKLTPDMMFCPECGYRIQNTVAASKPVPSYAAPESTRKDSESTSGTKLKFKGQYGWVGALIDFFIGLPCFLFGIITYMDDTSGWYSSYTYRAPLTDHEYCVIVFLIIGAVALFCSAIGMIVYFSRLANYLNSQKRE